MASDVGRLGSRRRGEPRKWLVVVIPAVLTSLAIFGATVFLFPLRFVKSTFADAEVFALSHAFPQEFLFAFLMLPLVAIGSFVLSGRIVAVILVTHFFFHLIL